MWTFLLVGVALAGKWDAANADISATGFVPAPPEQAYGYLLDLRHQRALFSTDCVGKFEPGANVQGVGANGIIRYDMGLMHRRLPIALTQAVPATKVEFEHAGARGFITRWTFQPEAGGTRVTVTTPLYPPPTPLQGYYYRTVQPQWKACYTAALIELSRALGA